MKVSHLWIMNANPELLCFITCVVWVILEPVPIVTRQVAELHFKKWRSDRDTISWGRKHKLISTLAKCHKIFKSIL